MILKTFAIICNGKLKTFMPGYTTSLSWLIDYFPYATISMYSAN